MIRTTYLGLQTCWLISIAHGGIPADGHIVGTTHCGRPALHPRRTTPPQHRTSVDLQERPHLLQPQQLRSKVATDARGALLEMLLLDDAQRGHAGGARGRAAAVRVEVLHAVGERRGMLWGGHLRRRQLALARVL